VLSIEMCCKFPNGVCLPQTVNIFVSRQSYCSNKKKLFLDRSIVEIKWNLLFVMM